MMKEVKESFNDWLNKESNCREPSVFVDYLPYRIFDESSNIFYNESSVSFCLEVTPLCGATKEIVDTISCMITGGVPEGTSIQIYNWASPNIKKYFDIWSFPRESKGGVYSKLSQKRKEYFNKANEDSLFDYPYIIRDFRIYICVSMPCKRKSNVVTSLESLRTQLISTIKTSGMGSRNIGANDFLNFVDELTNPFSSKRRVKKWDNREYLNNHLSDYERTIDIDSGGLKISNGKQEKDVRVFTVFDSPDDWRQWQNQDLIGDFYSDFQRMACPFVKVFSFSYGNDASISNGISIKLMKAIKRSNSGLSRYDSSIPEMERDLKFVDKQLKENDRKLLKTSYQIVTFSNPDEGDRDERQIKSIFNSKGWTILKDVRLQIQIYLSTLPFNYGEGYGEFLSRFKRCTPLLTNNCANVAPLQGEWKGHVNPKVLLFGRRGQPMYWDPFSNVYGNYNVSFVGKSGSGKSVAMQETVCSLLATGGQVVVIDDGRSFMNSCLLQGGSFIEFSTKGNICLNPFSMISEEVFLGNPDYKEEVLNFINLLITQMCKDDERASKVEKSHIEEAILFVWESKKTQGSVTEVADYLFNLDDPRAKDLGLMLSKYTKKGLYSRFFEGQATIKLDNPFYVFEFDRLKSKPDLLKVVVMVVMFLATEKAFHGDRMQTTSLVIDEAHSLLGGAQGADACEAFARKSRKHKAQLITGTQSIDDYYKNPAGNAIVQNTDWFCLLSQNAESVEAMKESKRILIDPQMEKALKSLRMVDHQYSEMMVYGGGVGWFIGRLILDPYSIALYSSKGEDFKKIQDYQSHGLSLEDAIEKVSDEIKFNKEK